MKVCFTIILSVALLVLFAGNGLAIEKDKTGTGQKHSAEIDSQQKASPPAKSNTATTQNKQNQGKGYDSFVDKNKNGIDDRAEKSKNRTSKQSTGSSSKKTSKGKP